MFRGIRQSDGDEGRQVDMRIFIEAKDGMMPTTDMLHLLLYAQDKGYKVTVGVSDGEVIKHIRKIMTNLERKEPKYTMMDTRGYAKIKERADIIIDEDCLEGLKDIIPNSRPSYDSLGWKDKKAETEKDLLADKIRRNNEHLYYLSLTGGVYEDSTNPEEYARVSYIARDLMELDELLKDDEIVLFDFPREYETLINKKSFKHIKFIYWRYNPALVLNACEKMITDRMEDSKGYASLTQRPVIKWTTPKEVVTKIRNDNTDSKLRDSRIYNVCNTKTWFDYLAKDVKRKR